MYSWKLYEVFVFSLGRHHESGIWDNALRAVLCNDVYSIILAAYWLSFSFPKPTIRPVFKCNIADVTRPFVLSARAAGTRCQEARLREAARLASKWDPAPEDEPILSTELDPIRLTFCDSNEMSQRLMHRRWWRKVVCLAPLFLRVDFLQTLFFLLFLFLLLSSFFHYSGCLVTRFSFQSRFTGLTKHAFFSS